MTAVSVTLQPVPQFASTHWIVVATFYAVVIVGSSACAEFAAHAPYLLHSLRGAIAAAAALYAITWVRTRFEAAPNHPRVHTLCAACLVARMTPLLAPFANGSVGGTLALLAVVVGFVSGLLDVVFARAFGVAINKPREKSE